MAGILTNYPVGTRRKGNVESTSMQRHDVAPMLMQRCIDVDATLHKCHTVISTLIRRCINVMCLQGSTDTSLRHGKEVIRFL